MLLPLPSRVWVPALLLPLLAACTTIDDFRRYTPDQRAQLVCERQADIGALDMRLGEVSRLHDETKAALDRGYHIHRQCRKVPTTVTEVCEQKGSKRVCKTREGGKPRQECEDTPVPLDLSLETGKLAAYTRSLDELTRERHTAWERCIAHVRGLSPEAAFNLF